MTQQANTPPIKEFRAGTISASIWRNEVERNGAMVVRHSIRIQKRFRQDDGNWRNTDRFFPEELEKLRLVAAKAFEFTSLTESEGGPDSPETY